jgi:transcriptional regulator with XRE-family HTH domain
MHDESNEQHRFGLRFRALRIAGGWTQASFAAHAGVHEQFVGAVERGERNVTLRNITRLAAGLGVPVAALFDERERTE